MENLLIILGIILDTVLIAVHSKRKFGKVNLPWTIGVPVYFILSYAVMIGRYSLGGDDLAAGLGGFIAQFIGFAVYWLFKGRLPAEKGVKQPMNDWLTAFIYFLISGLVIPNIISYFAGRFLYFWLFMLGGPIGMVVGIIIVGALSYWAGIVITTRYVTENYLIKNPGKILNLAVLFLIISKALSAAGPLRRNVGDAPYVVFLGLIAVAIYYFLSKRYLLNNEQKTPNLP